MNDHYEHKLVQGALDTLEQLGVLLNPENSTGGSTIMTIAPFIAQTYYAQVPGATRNGGIQNSGAQNMAAQADDAMNSAQNEYWIAPCDAKFPDLILHIGGGTVVISGDKL